MNEAEDSNVAAVVRVLPDEPAIAKTFDYLVPEGLGDQVRVGTRVRIGLGRRRVGGWVVATAVAPAVPPTELRPLAKVSGFGPTPDLIDLAEWAAWRWAGRQATFLRTASPERVVTSLPPAARSRVQPPEDPLLQQAFAAGQAVVRLPPAADLVPLCLAGAARGNTLLLCPTAALARSIGRRLRTMGVTVAEHPRDWAAGAAGATVVGTRAAAWTPVGSLAAIVVLDEHDEAHAQEQAPTWHSRDVAIERARRARVPCVLASPCPSLEALGWGLLLTTSRSEERDGWPVVDVLDRRRDDPRTGLFSPGLVEQLRNRRKRILCVLNRTGRARLLACAACAELARCEVCDAAMTQLGEGELTCPRCGHGRPVICTVCGRTRLKLLRQGVSRVREELEALVGEPVGEVTATSSGAGRVVVGTEAVLHQVERADVVAFLDFDQELLAPRYRAVEQAMALVVRAARLLGSKRGGGRLVLQTRLPRHEVVQAALQADPSRVAKAEAERRELLRFPPTTALAEVSGAAADRFSADLRGVLGVEILGPADGRWLLRADDHQTLCDALAATRRPPGRLRVAVDPLRV